MNKNIIIAVVTLLLLPSVITKSEDYYPVIEPSNGYKSTVEPKPNLEISIKIGFSFGKTTATIKNIGDAPAHNVNLTLFVEYGFLVKTKNNSNDTVSLAPGTSQTIEMEDLRGFGPITVTAAAHADTVNEIKEEATGWIIWYLVLIKNHDHELDELEKDINNGMSIMMIEPHPDDEVYTPGIFMIAGNKGNKCWVVALISVDHIPEQAREARRQAISWFEEKYLEEYINLGMARGIAGKWHGWEWDFETIKAKYKEVIEEKQPDILLTFSPYGSCDLPEHYEISNIITNIWDELTYEPKPKIYWFINTDQGPRVEECNEDEHYPPTDVLNLDTYSDKLGMTYWEAKIEIWQKYAPSVPPLYNILDPDFLEKNDKKEYFVRYK